MENLNFLHFATMVMLTITICIALSSFLRLGTIIGFIAAGIALGPHTPGLVAATDIEFLQQIADFGVVLFLFTIGLEVKPQELWKMKKGLVIQGLGQVVLTALIFSGIYFYAGFSWQLGLVFGLIFAQSSTAVVMTMLEEKGEVNAAHGKNIFTNLMGQDLSIVPVMALIPVLAHQQAPESSGVVLPLLLGVSAVAAIFVIGRYLLPNGLRWAVKVRNKEGFVLCLFVALVATLWLVDEVGLSSTLGAFLLGMCLSNSDFRFSLESVVSPFKGVLMGLFFISVGMSVDPIIASSNLGQVLLTLVAIVIVKLVVFVVLAKVDGKSNGIAIKTGFALSQVGEFAFVLLGLAATIGIISTDQGAIGIVVVSLSMVITPWLYQLGNKLVSRKLHKSTPSTFLPNDDTEQALVVVGLDEVGRLIALLAKRAQIPYVAVDIDYDSVQRAKALGLNAHFGDITLQSVRKKAGLNKANAAFVSLTHSESLRKVCLMLAHYPQLDIYARTNSRADEFYLKDHGIEFVGATYIESTLLRGRQLLKNFGLADDEVMTLIDDVKSDLFEEEYLKFKQNQ
ncbi:cation:proton antiporter domain-containing protein [Vibrio agarivorans]|uniref:cation:proton antiporter domain-containing protein n=1 Tax=Vibrio agarivorans TaxID=153622 RepID=UPI00222E511D|nr:cation:proton antiporter [Vibrio agarivorans]MDN3659670.1 cation:proton antiporter [Vibrio agarivorans]